MRLELKSELGLKLSYIKEDKAVYHFQRFLCLSNSVSLPHGRSSKDLDIM